MKKSTINALIIGSTIIWAAVTAGSSIALKGTVFYDNIQNILAGGVIAHPMLIWGPFVVTMNKQKGRSKCIVKKKRIHYESAFIYFVTAYY